MPIEGSQLGSGNLLQWAGAERVTLAIVFTDIVGSTALGVQLGDQRMNEVRLAHFAHSQALISKYAGRQVKTIGDSVMVVFRSVRSALDYAHTLHLHPGDPELHTKGVRAGIHVGETDVVDDDVFGTEVAFAARVVHAIEGAEIWLSGRAREAIDRAGAPQHRDLNWLQHDEVDLKGLGKYPLWSLIPDPTANPREPASPTLAPDQIDARPQLPQLQEAANSRPITLNGRTIFVARPAADMRLAYVRIVDELKNRGFTVVPAIDIPSEAGAINFIDSALATAELSIHLLGEKAGLTPDETGAAPIVTLQLARAAIRSLESNKDRTGSSEFQRIVWAPKILEDPTATQGTELPERDPIKVLERFGEQRPTDKVPGENLIQFINFLHQFLDKTRPRGQISPRELAPGTKIFIDHAMDDLDYATELAIALESLSLDPRLATVQGKPALVNAQNRREMLDCDGVALCWGNTSEAWVRAEASKLDGWRRNARLDRFEATLLAAPPSHKVKERWLRIKLPGVDRVINLTNVDKPSPAELDKWLGTQSRAGQGDG
jgi:class 3 adenylate cyclase